MIRHCFRYAAAFATPIRYAIVACCHGHAFADATMPDTPDMLSKICARLRLLLARHDTLHYYYFSSRCRCHAGHMLRSILPILRHYAMILMPFTISLHIATLLRHYRRRHFQVNIFFILLLFIFRCSYYYLHIFITPLLLAPVSHSQAAVYYFDVNIIIITAVTY